MESGVHQGSGLRTSDPGDFQHVVRTCAKVLHDDSVSEVANRQTDRQTAAGNTLLTMYEL